MKKKKNQILLLFDYSNVQQDLLETHMYQGEKLGEKQETQVSLFQFFTLLQSP